MLASLVTVAVISGSLCPLSDGNDSNQCMFRQLCVCVCMYVCVCAIMRWGCGHVGRGEGLCNEDFVCVEARALDCVVLLYAKQTCINIWALYMSSLDCSCIL